MSRAITLKPEYIEQQLNRGLSEMGLTTDVQECAQLIAYLSMMIKWNHVYNLSAIREGGKMVSHHLLDSLVIVEHFRNWLSEKAQPSVLDVGTGGGLPGVVLAIMNPAWQLTLIDPVHKKTAFLTQVKAELNLKNLTVVTGKVETLNNVKYDLITSRAFASIADFVLLSSKVLKSNGFFGAMKGLAPIQELDELAQREPHVWLTEITALKVPQLDAERHLIKLWRQ